MQAQKKTPVFTTADLDPDRLNHPVTRLTALWALNESGLGGLMFALKIPLTGFFVGGFAVILITLIAHFSQNDYKKILRATILVLIIKATVSPHSPPPAYLAVAFQGLAGALLYRIIPNFRAAAILLAVLAMAESALQKLIMLTLVYGKSIWTALDKLAENISREFSLHAPASISYRLIVAYIGLYVGWGLFIGIFAARLPEKIKMHTGETLFRYREMSIKNTAVPSVAAPRRKGMRWLTPGLILLFIIAAFALSGSFSEYRLVFIVVRAIAAILLLFFVVRPVAGWLIRRWLKSRDHAVKEEAAGIIDMLPRLRLLIRPAWEMAGSRERKPGRLRSFVMYLIILTLYES